MRTFLGILVLVVAGTASAREPAVPPGLKVDRVVLLMRHGVRPPTKAPPMPVDTASADWPSWSVSPGYLTPHGAAAVREVALYDRAQWTAQGLLPRRGCFRVRIVADSDQRTIATAQAYAAALAPGCSPAIEHRPQDQADPLFSPIDERAVHLDAQAARAAVLAASGSGGIAREEAALRPQLARLDAILCGQATASCGVGRPPPGLAPLAAGKRPKLTGALDRASTAAQILLLEYAEGKPMSEVGWGRATAADVESLSAFHATEFRLLARPRPIAKANLALLTPLIAAALTDVDAAPITMISGHDTNVASLGGLLGVHWHVPGLAADDPSPGGALMIERLSDAAGHCYFRVLYRSQTVEQIRALTPLDRAEPYSAVLDVPRCRARGRAGLCSQAAMFDLLGEHAR